MSGFKTIAVAGAGNVGQFIIEELTKLKKEGVIDNVVQLSRSVRSTLSHSTITTFTETIPKAGGHKQTLGWGVELRVVDYTDYDGLVQALQGVDAVVSALGGGAFALQEQFAEAAKKAGVKLFVPSEFGNPTKDRKDSFFAVKDGVRLKLKEIGLPYAIFYTGPFSDYVFNP